MNTQMDFLHGVGLADFSPCRKYRYTLRRAWGVSCASQVMFVMLNPSTADEVQDDPTIRRCIGFAKSWGFQRLVVCNLFAWRSTDPMALRTVADPIGKDNDDFIADCAAESEIIICAWGVHGSLHGRGPSVEQYLSGLDQPTYHLGRTKDGSPKHPLYLPANVERIATT